MIDDVELRPGDRVRLRPGLGGDIFDLALAGKTATIESIEQDYEDQFHVAVTLDDDPGRGSGPGPSAGPSFLLQTRRTCPARLCGGPHMNTHGSLLPASEIFFWAMTRLASRSSSDWRASTLPPGVEVVDFGIRGMDLIYSLLGGYSAAILINAIPGGQRPGTLYLIEPDPGGANEDDSGDCLIEAHSLDPARSCGWCGGWTVTSGGSCWSAASPRRPMRTTCDRGSVSRSPRP